MSQQKAGVSINFDAQALHDAEEEEYRREEYERQNELRAALMDAFDDDLSDEESDMSRDHGVSMMSHDVSRSSSSKSSSDQLTTSSHDPVPPLPLSAPPPAPLTDGARRDLGHLVPVSDGHELGRLIPETTAAPHTDYTAPAPEQPYQQQPYHQYDEAYPTNTYNTERYYDAQYADGYHGADFYSGVTARRQPAFERGEIEGANDEDNTYQDNYGRQYRHEPYSAYPSNTEPAYQPNHHYPSHDVEGYNPESHTPTHDIEPSQPPPRVKSPERPVMSDQPERDLDSYRVQYQRTQQMEPETANQKAAGSDTTPPRPSTPGGSYDDLQKEFNSKGSQQVEQLQILYTARGRKIDELTQTLADLQEDSDRDSRILKHKLTLAQDERNGLSDSLDQCQLLLKESHQREADVSGRATALEKQLEALTAAKNDLIAKVTAQESTIESLNAQLMTLEASESLTRARNQHDSIVSGLTQKHEAEIFSLKQKIDLAQRRSEDKDGEITNLKKQVVDLVKSSEIAQIDRADTINRLTRSLEESQRQCQELLEQGHGQEASKTKMQLQEVIAGKSIAEDMNSALQSELKEMKEQVMMYESASHFGVFSTSTLSRKSAGPAAAAAVGSMDDSYSQLAIKPSSTHTLWPTGTDSPSLSTEDTIHGLKGELERCLQMYKNKREQLSQAKEGLRVCKASVEEFKVKVDRAQQEAAQYKAELTVLKEQVGDSLSSANPQEAMLRKQYDKLAKEKEVVEINLAEVTKRLEETATNEEEVSALNHELMARMAQMVQEFDEDKKTALEKCQENVLRHHEDNTKRLRQEFEDKFSAEQAKLEGECELKLQELRDELQTLREELDDVKEHYVTVCKEKDEIEERLTEAHQQDLELKLQECKAVLTKEKQGALQTQYNTLNTASEQLLIEAKEQWNSEKEDEIQRQVHSQIGKAKADTLEEQQRLREEAVEAAVLQNSAGWQQKLDSVLREEVDKAVAKAQEDWESRGTAEFEEQVEEKLKSARLTWEQEDLMKALTDMKEQSSRDLERQLELALCKAQEQWKTEQAQAQESNNNNNQAQGEVVPKEEVDKTVNALKQELDRVSSEKVSLTQELDRVSSEKVSLTQELDRVSSEKVSLTQELDRVSSEKVSLTQELDRVSSEKVSLTQELDQLSSEKVSFGQELEQLSSEKMSLSQELDQVSSEKLSISQELEQLSSEKASLTKDFEEVSSEKLVLSEELSQVQAENASLSRELSEARDQCREDVESSRSVADAERSRIVLKTQQQSAAEYRQFLDEHKGSLTKALAAAQETHTQDKEALEKQYKDQIDILKKNVTNAACIQEALEKEHAERELEWQARLDEVLQSHQEELDGLVLSHRENMAAALAEVQSRWQQKLESALEQTERTVLLQREREWEKERVEYLAEIRERDQLLHNADLHLEQEMAKLQEELAARKDQELAEEVQRYREQAESSQVHRDCEDRLHHSLADLAAQHQHELQNTVSELQQRHRGDLTDLERSLGVQHDAFLQQRLRELEEILVARFEAQVQDARDDADKEFSEKLSAHQEETEKVLTKLEDSRKQLKELYTKYTKDTRNLAKKMEQMDEQYKRAKQEASDCEVKFTSAEKKNQELEDKLDSLRKGLEKAEKQKQTVIEAMKQSAKEQEDIVANLQTRLSEASEKAQRAENQLKLVKSESQHQLLMLQESMDREQQTAVDNMKVKIVDLGKKQATVIENLKAEHKKEIEQMLREKTVKQDEKAVLDMREQYLEAVEKIREDVVKHMTQTNEKAAATMKLQVIKERQLTARRLRRYYMKCLSHMLDKECDPVTKQQKLTAMERYLERVTEREVSEPETSRSNTPSGDSSSKRCTPVEQLPTDEADFADISQKPNGGFKVPLPVQSSGSSRGHAPRPRSQSTMTFPVSSLKSPSGSGMPVSVTTQRGSSSPPLGRQSSDPSGTPRLDTSLDLDMSASTPNLLSPRQVGFSDRDDMITPTPDHDLSFTGSYSDLADRSSYPDNTRSSKYASVAKKESSSLPIEDILNKYTRTPTARSHSPDLARDHSRSYVPKSNLTSKYSLSKSTENLNLSSSSLSQDSSGYKYTSLRNILGSKGHSKSSTHLNLLSNEPAALSVPPSRTANIDDRSRTTSSRHYSPPEKLQSTPQRSGGTPPPTRTGGTPPRLSLTRNMRDIDISDSGATSRAADREATSRSDREATSRSDREVASYGAGPLRLERGPPERVLPQPTSRPPPSSVTLQRPVPVSVTSRRHQQTQ